jgi:hypothetical protein
MESSMSLTLAGNLIALEQMATRCMEDISKSKRKASRYRSISVFFSTYTKDPAHPDKWAELLVAKEFQDRADMEEALVLSRLKRLSNMADLRERMFVLLERVEKLEASDTLDRGIRGGAAN